MSYNIASSKLFLKTAVLEIPSYQLKKHSPQCRPYCTLQRNRRRFWDWRFRLRGRILFPKTVLPDHSLRLCKPSLRRFFVFKVVPLKGSQNFLHKRIFKKERTEVFAMPDRQPFFPNATHRERDRRMREAPNRLLSRFPTKPEDLPSAVCNIALYRHGSYCGSCA